jgi:alpha-L-rhamnosidase
MASLIGEKEDAGSFLNKAEEIRKSFNDKFFNRMTYIYSTGSQTAYAMPLYFGIVDDTSKMKVVKNLIKSINENNNALTAGDIGYRYLLRVLEQEGYSNLIYEMNSKTDIPGYGYQLSKGATSLTESWAALEYVSNNHMMLGHLMEWFYSGIGYIKQAPGSNSFNKIIISPEITGDLTWAETTYNTILGEIATRWKIDGNNFIMKVKIPIGCIAIVAIPQTNTHYIFEGENLIDQVQQVKILENTFQKTLCEISSGEYNFRWHIKN